jgi:hypothetical protein
LYSLSMRLRYLRSLERDPTTLDEYFGKDFVQQPRRFSQRPRWLSHFFCAFSAQIKLIKKGELV